jgi:hypothetical protein
MEDFFAKIIGNVILGLLIRIIERMASSQYAADVVHAIHERYSERGAIAAVWSALRTLLRAWQVREANENAVEGVTSDPVELGIFPRTPGESFSRGWSDRGVAGPGYRTDNPTLR